MRDFRYHIHKELLEAFRTKKLMVLGIVVIFFALLDPVMLRLTPYMLEQIGGIDISGMIQLSQVAQMKEFQQDIYQLFTIVLVIIIGNVWLNEVKQETLIIPLSKGLKLGSIMKGKIVVYALYVNLLMLAGYSINYYYSGVIFGFGVDYYQVVISAMLMGIFYTFAIVLIIALSPVISNFPGVVFVTLIILFGGPFLVSLLEIEAFTPFGLLNEAAMFPRMLSKNIPVTIVCMMMISSMFYYVGIKVAGKKEIVKYR